MAGQKIPYPPSPENVPEDLTEYPDSYKSQQNLLLAGLFVFLLFYLGLIFLCMLLGTWCLITIDHFFPVKLVGIILCGTFFLFLVKGFFKRRPVDKTLYIEVEEEEQPLLFGFIHKLCEELGAPEPRKVWIAPDVNAAVTYKTNVLNLFVQPEKDLVIGLGLVNAVNMSEFKAVLAHEFGHFGQSSYASSYTYVASRIIIDLVEGEDWFDRMIDFCKRQENALAVFGYVIGAPIWVGRMVLGWLLKAITLQRLAVSREQEFHADSVAASVAGSDAVVHCLLRAEFGHICLMQALQDLSVAADHKLYTRDLYLHQDRSAAIVRRNKKDPKLGLPPELDSPHAGKRVVVFDREEEELEEEEIPPMWRTHPSNADREESVKEQFVPAVVDHRSPWILFTDAAELKERVAYKFYRMVHKIRKDTELDDPDKVQAYIDGEHADTTYDPKYQGIYDDRKLDPGEISELNQIIRESPWDEGRINKVFEKLYEGAAGKHEEYDELHKEKATLENTPGRPSGRMKRKIEKVEKQLDKVWEWFQSFDRRVYLVHVQMGQYVNREWADELVERYRFQMEIQRLYLEARFHQGKAYAFANVLFNVEDPHPEFVAEVMQVLRQAWRALKNILKDAREINLPAMRNFEEGERLVIYRTSSFG
jgi:Zn-dependent protease with chaperone function